MKRLLFLPMIFIVLASQGQKCKEPNDWKNRDELKKYAECFLKDTTLRLLLMEFNIPGEMKMKDPGLIPLIIESRSMEPNSEKQSWFNLYKSMTREQIEQLFDILGRERIKINEIEKKYEARKVEIKNKYEKGWVNGSITQYDDSGITPIETILKNRPTLSDQTFKFLGSTKQNPNDFNLWLFDFKTNQIVQTGDTSKRCSYSDFNIFIPDPDEDYPNKIHKLLIETYLSEIFDLEPENQYDSATHNRLYTSTLPNYSIQFLRYGIRYFYTAGKFKELEQLLLVQPSEFGNIPKNENIRKYINTRNEYSSYYNTISRH
ncbi:MAG: hypothetical protein WCK34_12835 [Bacteroidota bacterium]